ncbi:hypothetical protein D3C85_1524180 [compost metagenome]
MQVQHATQGMTDAPDRAGLLLQVMDQFVDQVLPVVIDRKTRIVGVLGQVGHLIVGGQRSKELAVSGRGEAIGMGEEDLLRHGRQSRGK